MAPVVPADQAGLADPAAPAAEVVAGGGTVTPVQIRVSVLAQSSANTAPVTLGTVTLTAQ